MNRKAQAKANRELEAKEKEIIALAKAKENRIHPYDDINNWLSGDTRTAPWSEQKIQQFQDRLDSAFEAKNGIRLVWSGDRRFGDAFFNEKGELEHKPPLLFAEQKIEGTNDYIYIVPTRWLLMETIHGSQLEAGWEEASIVNVQGVNVRIRPERPPEYAYQHLKIIAEHDETQLIGEMPRCCQLMYKQNRICYGRYREPSEADIAFVGRLRQNMNKAGVFQRNDTERSKKVLMDGALATRHYIKRAKEQQANRVKEIMLANAEKFFGDVPAKVGTTKTYKELEHIFKEALDKQDEERGLDI